MNIKIEPTNLCTCNNCDNIFLDSNPQIGAKKFTVNVFNFESLEVFIYDGEFFYGCPFCKTDAFLSDDVDEIIIKSF